jgi:hypothetical protein
MRYLKDSSEKEFDPNLRGPGHSIKVWEQNWHWRISLLVSVACADCDTPLNLLDCLADYLDGVDPVTAFVVRGLHEFIARLIQGIERPFHVTLVGMGALDQRNRGDEREHLAEKSGFHESFRAFRGRMLWKFARGQGNLFTRALAAGSSQKEPGSVVLQTLKGVASNA